MCSLKRAYVSSRNIAAPLRVIGCVRIKLGNNICVYTFMSVLPECGLSRLVGSSLRNKVPNWGTERNSGGAFRQRWTPSDNGERIQTTVDAFRQRWTPSDNGAPFKQRCTRSYNGERLSTAVERNVLTFRDLHISGCENLRTLKCVTHCLTVSYAPRVCLFTLFMS